MSFFFVSLTFFCVTLDFRISIFGFWSLDFGILGFGFLEFGISGFGFFWIFGFWIRGFGFWDLDFFWIFRFWIFGFPHPIKPISQKQQQIVVTNNKLNNKFKIS